MEHIRGDIILDTMLISRTEFFMDKFLNELKAKHSVAYVLGQLILQTFGIFPLQEKWLNLFDK